MSNIPDADPVAFPSTYERIICSDHIELSADDCTVGAENFVALATGNDSEGTNTLIL